MNRTKKISIKAEYFLMILMLVYPLLSTAQADCHSAVASVVGSFLCKSCKRSIESCHEIWL